MLSYLLLVVSLVGHSGFVNQSDSSLSRNTETMEFKGDTTGGLVVTMGPVMNMRVADVRVIRHSGGGELPAIAPKGSLFEGFSKSRLYAVRYGK